MDQERSGLEAHGPSELSHGPDERRVDASFMRHGPIVVEKRWVEDASDKGDVHGHVAVAVEIANEENRDTSHDGQCQSETQPAGDRARRDGWGERWRRVSVQRL